jgi:hypothetical protein
MSAVEDELAAQSSGDQPTVNRPTLLLEQTVCTSEERNCLALQVRLPSNSKTLSRQLGEERKITCKFFRCGDEMVLICPLQTVQNLPLLSEINQILDTSASVTMSTFSTPTSSSSAVCRTRFESKVRMMVFTPGCRKERMGRYTRVECRLEYPTRYRKERLFLQRLNCSISLPERKGHQGCGLQPACSAVSCPWCLEAAICAIQL